MWLRFNFFLLARWSHCSRFDNSSSSRAGGGATRNKRGKLESYRQSASLEKPATVCNPLWRRVGSHANEPSRRRLWRAAWSGECRGYILRTHKYLMSITLYIFTYNHTFTNIYTNRDINIHPQTNPHISRRLTHTHGIPSTLKHTHTHTCSATMNVDIQYPFPFPGIPTVAEVASIHGEKMVSRLHWEFVWPKSIRKSTSILALSLVNSPTLLRLLLT